MDDFDRYGPSSGEEETSPDQIRVDDFDWDDEKAESNLGKHGVSFEEAASCFLDREHKCIRSPIRKSGEQRWILFGTSSAGRPIVVVFALEKRNKQMVARVISARRGTR